MNLFKEGWKTARASWNIYFSPSHVLNEIDSPSYVLSGVKVNETYSSINEFVSNAMESTKLLNEGKIEIPYGEKAREEMTLLKNAILENFNFLKGIINKELDDHHPSLNDISKYNQDFHKSIKIRRILGFCRLSSDKLETISSFSELIPLLEDKLEINYAYYFTNHGWESSSYHISLKEKGYNIGELKIAIENFQNKQKVITQQKNQGTYELNTKYSFFTEGGFEEWMGNNFLNPIKKVKGKAKNLQERISRKKSRLELEVEDVKKMGVKEDSIPKHKFREVDFDGTISNLDFFYKSIEEWMTDYRNTEALELKDALDNYLGKRAESVKTVIKRKKELKLQVEQNKVLDRINNIGREIESDIDGGLRFVEMTKKGIDYATLQFEQLKIETKKEVKDLIEDYDNLSMNEEIKEEMLRKYGVIIKDSELSLIEV